MNNISLIDRMRHWLETIYLLNTHKYGWILGTGLLPNKFFAEYLGVEKFLVDNTYLIFILYGGIVGLVVMLLLFIKIFSITVKYAQVSNNLFWKSLAAYYFSVPTGMVFTDQHLIPFFLFVLVATLQPMNCLHILNEKIKIKE